MKDQVGTLKCRLARVVAWCLFSIVWVASAAYSFAGDRRLAQGSNQGSANANALAATAESSGSTQEPRSRPQTPLFLIPNFHDASMGWLVSYAEERNFGLYSYLAHLDRVTADPQYKFVMSEIPRLITMMDFEPKRVEELRKRIAEGRVELVNAFVLEPTVSLSGFSVAGGNHIQQVRLASLLGQCT